MKGNFNIYNLTTDFAFRRVEYEFYGRVKKEMYPAKGWMPLFRIGVRFKNAIHCGDC